MVTFCIKFHVFPPWQYIQELPGAPQHAPFPTAPSRVTCLPEYFMYYNYLKRKAPGYEAGFGE